MVYRTINDLRRAFHLYQYRKFKLYEEFLLEASNNLLYASENPAWERFWIGAGVPIRAMLDALNQTRGGTSDQWWRLMEKWKQNLYNSQCGS